MGTASILAKCTEIQEAVVKLEKNVKIARAKYTRSKEEVSFKSDRVAKFEASLGDPRTMSIIHLSSSNHSI